LFANSKVIRKCYLPPSQIGIKSKLYAFVRIIDESMDDNGNCQLTIEIDQKHLGLLKDIKTEPVA
jgi:GTP-binding protein HflX